jgi:hypothetical protein
MVKPMARFKPPLVDLVGDFDKTSATPSITHGEIFVTINMNTPRPLNTTGIIVPDGHSAGGPLDMILYFHGDDAPTVKEYFHNRKFKDILDATKKNVVLVAPNLGPKSQYGDFGDAAKVAAYLDRVLGFLVDYGPYSSKPKLGNLIIAGHSGGGRAMQSVATLLGGNADFTLPEAWGFDSMYGKDDPLPAPEPWRVSEPKWKSAATMEDWDRRNATAEEFRWAAWVRAGTGRRFRLFWGTGGTKARTANLDFLSQRRDMTRQIDINPRFFKTAAGLDSEAEAKRTDYLGINPRYPSYHMVYTRIAPEPPPVADHDLVPQTALSRCIEQSSNLS